MSLLQRLAMQTRLPLCSSLSGLFRRPSRLSSLFTYIHGQYKVTDEMKRGFDEDGYVIVR
jgi:hypothetical protein